MSKDAKKNPCVRFNLECISTKYVPVGVESFACGETFVEAIEELIRIINIRDTKPWDSSGEWYKTYYYTCEDEGYYFYSEEDMDSEEEEEE